MNIVHAHKFRSVKPSAKIKALLPIISESQLRKWMEHISAPRHFGAEPEQKRATAEWLEGVFDSMGFRVERQGEFSNVIALPEVSFDEAISRSDSQTDACRGR